MLSAALVSDQNCSISGYIKAAAVERIKPDIPRFFKNNRPTILYSPHFDQKLSSWKKYGRDIVSYFQKQDRFNLIFAPHLRIWEQIDRQDKSFLEDAGKSRNILVDSESTHLVDMTYTRYADIYLGDVSSQVYEFILNPRPCIFILPENINYTGNQDYAHCRFGDVCFSPKDVFAALEVSQQRHEIFKDAQRAGSIEAFGEARGGGIDRAASIIEKVLADRAAAH